jgi:pyruvate formate lyase activating enzyme
MSRIVSSGLKWYAMSKDAPAGAGGEVDGVFVCDLCPHRCRLHEGQIGFCLARKAENGQVRPRYYGQVFSLALDPIEKKPLSHFYPGSRILSVGSLGCNMNCPYCQNAEIARPSVHDAREELKSEMSPATLVGTALKLREKRNIGLAFTYNEPLINYEYVRDTFILAKEASLKTVLITNGQILEPYLSVLLPLVDAWNIDLKCFDETVYRRLGGDLATVMQTIEKAADKSHVEITTLVPRMSDDDNTLERQAAWIAAIDDTIPLHLTRYFPRRFATEDATPLSTLYRLATVARRHLINVELGNI